MYRILLGSILLVALLAACGGTDAPEDGSVSASEGEIRVQARGEPDPIRVGQPAALTISVTDATSGDPLPVTEVRPVVQLRMPTSYMILPFEIETTEQPGVVIARGTPPEAGVLRISVGVKRAGVLIPIRLPDIPVEP